MNYFHTVLSNFKWYRKRVGGTWYKIDDLTSGGGIESPIRYWTQSVEHSDDLEMIDKEEW